MLSLAQHRREQIIGAHAIGQRRHAGDRELERGLVQFDRKGVLALRQASLDALELGGGHGLPVLLLARLGLAPHQGRPAQQRARAHELADRRVDFLMVVALLGGRRDVGEHGAIASLALWVFVDPDLQLRFEFGLLIRKPTTAQAMERALIVGASVVQTAEPRRGLDRQVCVVLGQRFQRLDVGLVAGDRPGVVPIDGTAHLSGRSQTIGSAWVTRDHRKIAGREIFCGDLESMLGRVGNVRVRVVCGLSIGSHVRA